MVTGATGMSSGAALAAKEQVGHFDGMPGCGQCEGTARPSPAWPEPAAKRRGSFRAGL